MGVFWMRCKFCRYKIETGYDPLWESYESVRRSVARKMFTHFQSEHPDKLEEFLSDYPFLRKEVDDKKNTNES